MYFIENACKIIFSESQNSCDKEFLNITHMYLFIYFRIGEQNENEAAKEFKLHWCKFK